MPLVAGARLVNVKDVNVNTFILFISWEIASGYFTSVNSGFVSEGTVGLSHRCFTSRFLILCIIMWERIAPSDYTNMWLNISRLTIRTCVGT